MNVNDNSPLIFPDWLLQKWQDIADLLAETIGTQVALIERTESEFMEVFISSHSENNPYTVGKKEKWDGLYCETVVKTQNKLLVPNATKDQIWAKSPDVKRGMIAYLGFPLNFPDNQPFGTLCVLDNKERKYTLLNEKLIRQFKHVIELDLALVQSFELKTSQSGTNVIQVIAEQKHIEAALHESEDRFQRMFNNAPLGYQSLDFDGNFIEVNQQWLNTLGYQREDVIGKWFGDFLSPAYQDGFRKRFPIFKAQGHIHSEFEMIHKNGSVLFIAFEGKIGYDIHGDFKQTHCILQDITEKRQVEQAFQESQKRLYEAQKLAHIGVWNWDAKTDKVIWSNELYQIAGRDPKLPAPTFTEQSTIFTPQSWHILKKAVKNTLKSGEEYQLELDLIRPDGSIRNVKAFGGATFDALGQITELFGTLQDFTERKQTEEDLKKSERKLIRQNELFDSLIKNLPMGVFMVEAPSGKPLVANEAALNILGRGILPDASKQNLAEVYSAFKNDIDHPYPIDEMPIVKGMNGESSYVDDMVVIRPDGTKTQLEIFGSTVRDAKGTIWASLVSFSDITNRKLSEAIFRDVIEKNPISIQILNMEGYTIQTNSAHAKLFGETPPSDYSIFNDAQLEQQGFKNLFEQIKKGEIVYFPDSYFNVHDLDPSFPDSPVWVKAVGFTLNDNIGRPERIVLMHENITERKHSEALLNDIIENNPMSIQIVDKGGYTLHGNPAYSKLFGAIPPPDFSIFDDLQNKSKELEQLIKLAKSGEVVHLPDIYFNAHDVVSEAPDIPLWIRALIFPLKSSGGKPERFVFMHENITERKKAELELIAEKQRAEESETKYRQIFDNTFDIMAIYEVTEDRRFKVITFNSAEAKLIGPLEYYQNRYIDECISPELYDQFKQNYYRCLTEEKLIVYEEDITFQDIRKSFYTQLIPLKNSAGRIHRIIVISRDITENKLLQTQLINQNEKLTSLNIDLIDSKEKAEESDRLKSAFLANMSHEIRTPMNGILGFAEILKDTELTGEQQQEYIKIIEKSGNRMLNIINDIIDISKIESGLMKMDLKESNVNEQIEYIYTFFKPEVEAKGMKLSFRTPLPAIKAILKTDREKLYAILTNLVKNAIKFSKEGAIEFGYSTETEDSAFLKFYVKDTGIGISTDRQEAIFERFIQADISDKMARQGAGLGLSISKAYIEMLGGRIWVESEVGIGSTFYFTLPYTLESEERTNTNNSVFNDEKFNQSKKLKILIGEDDETSEMLISITIKEFGQEVIKARTGIEAVDICRNNPNLDLILMDIQMPDLNGYDATRQIRQFNKDVVIIAQTAYGLSGDREKAIEAGCNDYIAKPINKTELILLIQKYFNKK